MDVIFYEKPGCINNTKQKNLLVESGHNVIPRSLLLYSFSADELRKFFNTMPVADWFNPSNPKIKNGEVLPSNFTEQTAIAAMLEEPLFIKRPLIEANGEYACGFNNDLVIKLLGNMDVSSVQSCPNINTQAKCD